MVNHLQIIKRVNNMELRPLGITKDIIEEMGLSITHMYDDLVFIDYNPFLIQFDDNKPSSLKIFFNIDCKKDVAENLEQQLKNAAEKKKFSIINSGHFEMKQKEGTEEIELKFMD